MTYTIEQQADDRFAVLELKPVEIAHFHDKGHAALFLHALNSTPYAAPKSAEPRAAEADGGLGHFMRPRRAEPVVAEPLEIDVEGLTRDMVKAVDRLAAEEVALALDDPKPAPAPLPVAAPVPRLAETIDLPSPSTFTDAQRDEFILAMLDGESSIDVAKRMGVNPQGIRGYQTGAKFKARRQELAAQRGLTPTAAPTTAPCDVTPAPAVSSPATTTPPRAPASSIKPLTPDEIRNLPPIATMGSIERTTFLEAVVAGEKASKVALRMGYNPVGIAGFLSGAAVKVERALIETKHVKKARPSTDLVVRYRAPMTMGLPPSVAVDAECADCGKSIKVTDYAIANKCATCRG